MLETAPTIRQIVGSIYVYEWQIEGKSTRYIQDFLRDQTSQIRVEAKPLSIWALLREENTVLPFRRSIGKRNLHQAVIIVSLICRETVLALGNTGPTLRLVSEG